MAVREGGGGWAEGDSLIKTALLICILSKGTTVSSVRAQMVLCLEGERETRRRSLEHRFFFSFQAMGCPKYLCVAT